MKNSRTIKTKVINEFVDLYSDTYDYLVYYSGRSTGKSYAVAESQIIRGMSKRMRFLDVREIQKSLNESVKAMLESIIVKLNLTNYFEILRDRIICTTTKSEWIFLGLRDDPEIVKSFAKINEVWVEEAQSLSQRSLQALLPTIREDNSRVIFTMNRLTDSDPVFVYFNETPPPRTLFKYLDPLTLDRYGLQPKRIIALRESEKNMPTYAHVWLGEPLSQVDNAVLDRMKLVAAFEKEPPDCDGAWEVGVDVARFGSDRTVFVARKGLHAYSLEVYQKKPLTEQAELLKQFLLQLPDANINEIRIKIDDTGVGSGLTDIAKDMGLNVVPVNFAQQAKDSSKYPNAASEMWFDFATILEDVNLYRIAGRRQELLTELSQRSWTFDNKGRRVIEQKSSFKAQGNRSPDIADALLLCFYEPKTTKVIEWW